MLARELSRATAWDGSRQPLLWHGGCCGQGATCRPSRAACEPDPSEHLRWVCVRERCLSGPHPPQAPLRPSALLVGDSFFMRRFPKSILCPLSEPAAPLPGWIWPGAAHAGCAQSPPAPTASHPAALRGVRASRHGFAGRETNLGPAAFTCQSPGSLFPLLQKCWCAQAGGAEPSFIPTAQRDWGLCSPPSHPEAPSSRTSSSPPFLLLLPRRLGVFSFLQPPRGLGHRKCSKIHQAPGAGPSQPNFSPLPPLAFVFSS